MDGKPHDESGLAEVAQFELASYACKVVCVDDVLPRHRNARSNARPQLQYADGEVAHFELNGHRYAIVCRVPDLAGCETTSSDPTSAPVDIRHLLTNRELQIVQLISMGYMTKQVSSQLHISEFTVRSYLKTIYCKLSVRSRAALVYRYAQSFNRGSRGA